MSTKVVPKSTSTVGAHADPIGPWSHTKGLRKVQYDSLGGLLLIDEAETGPDQRTLNSGKTFL